MFVVNKGYSCNVIMGFTAYLSQGIFIQAVFNVKLVAEVKVNAQYYYKKVCQYLKPSSTLSKVIKGYCLNS